MKLHKILLIICRGGREVAVSTMSMKQQECAAGAGWFVKGEPAATRADDGLEIAYETLGPKGRTILLANGLGGRLYSWSPIVKDLAHDHRILTWDYRGMFGSGSPADPAHLEVPWHADDARAILDADGGGPAVLIGWSMGVQVALEFARRYPDRVAGLILINGTYGRPVQTAFQPLFRVPCMGKVLRELIAFTLQHPPVLDAAARICSARHLVEILGGTMAKIRGKPEIKAMYCQYSADVFGDDFENFLRLFQMIDAHSAIEDLPHLPHRALVMSGGFDMMTPAYQTRKIARTMPNARHVHFPWATHFVIIESTDKVIPLIRQFLDEAYPPQHPSHNAHCC